MTNNLTVYKFKQFLRETPDQERLLTEILYRNNDARRRGHVDINTEIKVVSTKDGKNVINTSILKNQRGELKKCIFIIDNADDTNIAKNLALDVMRFEETITKVAPNLREETEDQQCPSKWSLQAPLYKFLEKMIEYGVQVVRMHHLKRFCRYAKGEVRNYTAERLIKEIWGTVAVERKCDISLEFV